MKQQYLKLLGCKVFPIVKRQQYGAANFDTDGNLFYLSGDTRTAYAKRVVDSAVKKQQNDNKRMIWEVWSIHADGKFTLRSEYGYEQINVNRSDFRLIKK